MESSDCDYLVVAAIDFGTTYSGYAFSFTDEFRLQPDRVNTNIWRSGAQSASVANSLKAPTAVLFDSNKTFHSFGYEAEDKYAELCMDKEDKEWFYFQNFKMKLYLNEHLQRSFMLNDRGGRQLPAIDVFSECIRYLKRHLMDQMNRSRCGMEESDVKWIVTVPALWDDKAKQFMREASERAGINRYALSLALEPEAASVFCRYVLETWHDDRRGDVEAAFSRGSRYLVLDAGGGTVDITVHEVQANNRLKEIRIATGGPWGGTMVNEEFLELIKEVVGADVMEKFFTDHRDDFQDLVRDFEKLKQNVVMTGESSGRLRLRIPSSLIQVYKAMTHKDLEDAVRRSRLSVGSSNLSRDRLIIDSSIVEDLFRASIDKIVGKLHEVFRDPKCQNVGYIIMVGGFSESAVFRNAIGVCFPDKRTICPLDSGLVVLKGAVMYGHDTKIIAQRIAKVSYGICAFVDFIEGEDPPENKVVIGGQVKCKNYFKKHVTKGQELEVGQVQHEEVYNPVDDRQREMQFDIYTSPQAAPKYIEHAGCMYLGKLLVPVTGSGKNRDIIVGLMFGETELKVVVREKSTNKKTVATFDFLE